MKFRAPISKVPKFFLRPSGILATLRPPAPPDCSFGVRGFLEKRDGKRQTSLTSDYSHSAGYPYRSRTPLFAP